MSAAAWTALAVAVPGLATAVIAFMALRKKAAVDNQATEAGFRRELYESLKQNKADLEKSNTDLSGCRERLLEMKQQFLDAKRACEDLTSDLAECKAKYGVLAAENTTLRTEKAVLMETVRKAREA